MTPVRTGFVLIALHGGLSAFASEEIIYDYDEHIAPLLERYCVDCHGPEKQKSRFRLDTFNYLMTPGSSDEVPIVAYAPMESPLLEYLLMPKSDEYAMPPEGEPSPTAMEILQISQWIYHGAKSSEVERGKLPLDDQLDDTVLEAVQSLRARGGIVQKLEQQSTGLFVDLRGLGADYSAADQLNLELIAPLVVELNLSGLSGPIADQSDWSQFSRLQILGLNHSQLHPAALSSIASLPDLSRLGLFDTPLADQDLSILSQTNLHSLFVGSSGISPEQVQHLIELLPQTRIESDWDLSDAERIIEEAKSNSTTFRP